MLGSVTEGGLVQIDPKHLMIIAEISDAGGFTEAAISLGTSQPAISRVVKMLEQRLGEPIFHRVRKPLQLTSAGAVLADQGRAIRKAALRASDNLDRLRAGTEGSLRIGGTPFFLDGFVSGLIAEFHADRPNLTIDFTHGYTDELIALIVADRLDLALCPVDILAPEADVSFTPLLPGRNVIACRVGHPLMSKSKITPEDYQAYPWVAPPPRSPLNHDLRSALVVAGVERVRIAATGARLGTIMNYLIHTDCLSVLPHTVVFAMRRRGTVSALPVKLDHPARTLGLLLSRSTPPPPTARNLAAYLERSFRALIEEVARHEKATIETQG
jgi:DNA-binding transcriptional LysR family regulator